MTKNCGCCRAEPLIIRGRPCFDYNAPWAFFPPCKDWSVSELQAMPTGTPWPLGVHRTCAALGTYPPDVIQIIAGVGAGSEGYGTDVTTAIFGGPGGYWHLPEGEGCLYRTASTVRLVKPQGPGTDNVSGLTEFYYELDFTGGTGIGGAVIRRVTASHPDPTFPEVVEWRPKTSLEEQSSFHLVRTAENIPHIYYGTPIGGAPGPEPRLGGELPCMWFLRSASNISFPWCYELTLVNGGVTYTFPRPTTGIETGHLLPNGCWEPSPFYPAGYYYDVTGVVLQTLSEPCGVWNYRVQLMTPLGSSCATADPLYYGTMPYDHYLNPTTITLTNSVGEVATLTPCGEGSGSGSGSGSGGGGGLSDEECWTLAESLDDLLTWYMALGIGAPCDNTEPGTIYSGVSAILCDQIATLRSECAGTEAAGWFEDTWGAEL
jgi:hypothetical protein